MAVVLGASEGLTLENVSLFSESLRPQCRLGGLW